MKTALNIETNQTKEIVSIQENDFYLDLIEMGITPGSLIQLIRKTPFNGPYVFNISGNNIAIRKNMLEAIIVK
jgi:Fe2+ transport system protein FeoA